MDVDSGWWEALLTDDTELRYGNNPVVTGKSARDMFDQIFKQLDEIEHTIQYWDYVPPRIYQAVMVRYRVKGDEASQDITLPGLVTFFVKENKKGALECYRTESFIDPAPVFSRMAEKGNMKTS